MTNCEACKTAERRLVKGHSVFVTAIYFLFIIPIAILADYGVFLYARTIDSPGDIFWIAVMGFLAVLFTLDAFSLCQYLFIGQYSWHYKDANGDLHQHLDKPEGQWSVLMRLRHGGIFSRSAVWHSADWRSDMPKTPRSKSWCVRNWNGKKDVELTDITTGESFHKLKLSVESLLEVVENYTSVSHFVETATRATARIVEFEQENEKLRVEGALGREEVNALLVFVDRVWVIIDKKPRWGDSDREIAKAYNKFCYWYNQHPGTSALLKRHREWEGFKLPFELLEPCKLKVSAPEVSAETETVIVPPS